MATLKDSVVLVIRVMHVGTGIGDVYRKHIPVVMENYVSETLTHSFIKCTQDNY